MQELLPAAEGWQIEQHLHACDACLHEAQEASRVLLFLSSPHESSVPAALKAQVAAAWEIPPAEEPTALPRLVIQLVERGLRLIESYLLDVQEIVVPSTTFRKAAYRGGDSSSALSLRLNAGESKMDVLAVPEDDGVMVTLTLCGPEHKALRDRRVFLRQQGRAIFSAQTDQNGMIYIPRLDPGSYEVSCHELHTTFQLELRP
jgi:hypothetical protein